MRCAIWSRYPQARIYADFLCFLGGARQKSILSGFALPVREDIFSDIGSLLVRHFIGVLRTARKVIHFIIDPFPRKFGCQNAAFAIFAACADNQLALKNIDAKLITGIIKRLCGTNLRSMPSVLLKDSVQILARS